MRNRECKLVDPKHVHVITYEILVRANLNNPVRAVALLQPPSQQLCNGPTKLLPPLLLFTANIPSQQPPQPFYPKHNLFFNHYLSFHHYPQP